MVVVWRERMDLKLLKKPPPLLLLRFEVLGAAPRRQSSSELEMDSASERFVDRGSFSLPLPLFCCVVRVGAVRGVAFEKLRVDCLADDDELDLLDGLLDGRGVMRGAILSGAIRD